MCNLSFIQNQYATPNVESRPYSKSICTTCQDLNQGPSSCKLSVQTTSGDLRQGSFNNSITNFVQGFPYVFQREKQPSFEDLLLVVLVILRRRSATKFWPKVSHSISRFQNSIFGFPFDLPILQSQFCIQKTGKSLKISNPSGSFH